MSSCCDVRPERWGGSRPGTRGCDVAQASVRPAPVPASCLAESCACKTSPGKTLPGHPCPVEKASVWRHPGVLPGPVRLCPWPPAPRRNVLSVKLRLTLPPDAATRMQIPWNQQEGRWHQPGGLLTVNTPQARVISTHPTNACRCACHVVTGSTGLWECGITLLHTIPRGRCPGTSDNALLPSPHAPGSLRSQVGTSLTRRSCQSLQTKMLT